jgi:surface antigen
MTDPYITAQQVGDICSRLARIVGALTPPEASPEAYAAAQREDDRAAWWEAYLHAMTGLLAGRSGGTSFLAEDATKAADAALAALAARKARWDESPQPSTTQKEG